MYLTEIIPEEIQYSILKFLEAQYIVPSYSVCKLWHKVISSKEFELEKKLAFHPAVIEVTKSFPEEMITVFGGPWKVYCLPTLPIEKCEYISSSILEKLTSKVMRGSNCTKFPFVVVALNSYEKNKNQDNLINSFAFNVFYRLHERDWISEFVEYKKGGYSSNNEHLQSRDYTFIKEIFEGKKLERYGSSVKLKSEFPTEKSSSLV